ncbi:SMI1/KNR4 family protein [Clostridium sp. YIM B02505]|uniref:SMI1/KNR4 family protein n=1 Tax=Clostridium yunnanense TaxID=2800325 RepID=A0ABS1EJC2_9CLOT|nr:SMI1/KNR4 family protein [Clostridium yunnanense]MBK1809440.1 SMI1/KNR4 family protein [Clostridium yunnanense]
MNDIKWRRPHPPVIMEDIKDFENLVGFKFPEDYVNCALLYHGASVIPYRVEVKGSEKVFANLLSFSQVSVDSIIKIYDNCKERLKNGIIPFGIDPSGNFFCFDYRRDMEKPSIIFLNNEINVIASDYSVDELKRINLEEVQENAIEFVCNSFTELLSMLH